MLEEKKRKRTLYSKRNKPTKNQSIYFSGVRITWQNPTWPFSAPLPPRPHRWASPSPQYPPSSYWAPAPRTARRRRRPGWSPWRWWRSGCSPRRCRAPVQRALTGCSSRLASSTDDQPNKQIRDFWTCIGSRFPVNKAVNREILKN